MDSISRRNFMKNTAVAAAGVTAGPFITRGFAQNSPNDSITIASVGIRGRGQSLYQDFSKLPNVRVGTICDIDEREWPAAVKYIETNTGKTPKTEYDIRRVLDDKDIDAIVVATPDHWHSLAAIWACQAGKDVYVEKPVCHNLFEGRRLIDAARKYNRVVASGMQSRSNPVVRAAMKFLQDGKTFEKQGTSCEAGWAHEYGKGRVCFMAPGHMIPVLWNTEFVKLQHNAVKWLLG